MKNVAKMKELCAAGAKTLVNTVYVEVDCLRSPCLRSPLSRKNYFFGGGGGCKYWTRIDIPKILKDYRTSGKMPFDNNPRCKF
jgi:hypothetical protein